jgi:hypothetical protein
VSTAALGTKHESHESSCELPWWRWAAECDLGQEDMVGLPALCPLEPKVVWPVPLHSEIINRIGLSG